MMGADGASYREGRWKRRVRKRFASKESRAGLPKQQHGREQCIMRLLCGVAAIHLLGMMLLAQMGRPFWAQTLCLVLCLLCCIWAGLYETASDWQREAWRSTRSRDAKIAGLTKREDGLSEQDVAAMSGQAEGFERASGNDVADAVRRELDGN
jgi:hypothetical protein